MIPEAVAPREVPAHQVQVLGPRAHRAVLLIPVINEGPRLLHQLEAVQRHAPAVDVVVLDGGSDDGSTEIEGLRRRGVRALVTKTGPGRLSAQLRTGIDFALQQGYDHVLTMDGNGKDGVDGIDRIVQALEAGAGFVQGSRFVPGGRAVNTPRGRWLAIRLVHAPLTSLGARVRLTDSTNGFRGFSRAFLVDPRVAPLRDAFDSYELLAYLPVAAGRLHYPVREVPVSRTYPSAGPVPTKIRGHGAHADLLRILVRAVTGRYGPVTAGGIAATRTSAS